MLLYLLYLVHVCLLFSFSAIYGYNFCKSAARAFSILLANILRVGAINSVGFFILTLGKVAIIAAVEIIAFQWLRVNKI